MTVVLDKDTTHVSLDDMVREDESDRYGIYTLDREGNRQNIADCSARMIGPTLLTLHEEGQINGDDRLGIRDRLQRTWIVNPYARGRR